MSLTHTCMWNNSEINCVCEIFFSHTYVRAGAELICNAWYYSIYHIVTMLLVYMVGSVVFGQFRQLQKNQTKSMIHPSLTCPPWRHVVWINRLRYIQLPAQTSVLNLFRMVVLPHCPRKITIYFYVRSSLYHISYLRTISSRARREETC